MKPENRRKLEQQVKDLKSGKKISPRRQFDTIIGCLIDDGVKVTIEKTKVPTCTMIGGVDRWVVEKVGKPLDIIFIHTGRQTLSVIFDQKHWKMMGPDFEKAYGKYIDWTIWNRAEKGPLAPGNERKKLPHINYD